MLAGASAIEFTMQIQKTIAVTDAHAELQTVAAILAKPSGFTRLSSEQRKFLLATLLAAMVPADGKVKACEIEMLQIHLQGRVRAAGVTLGQTLAVARDNLCKGKDWDVAAAILPDLFSIEDRCNLIGMLWDIALSDHELHATEERMIYELADKAGVPRKTVIAQQARAASRAD